MRPFIYIFFLFSFFRMTAQDIISVKFPDHLSKTSAAALLNGDSLVYYQCHVDEAAQQIVKENGEVITGARKPISITEKFILINENGKYRLKYFTSTYTNLPNRKFAYLKLSKEKAYWDFRKVKDVYLNEHDVLMFGAIEHKSHEATEYDFPVTKYTTNALIIKNKKIMAHRVVEGNYLLKKNLEGLN
jgi:hypothetical protein